MAVGGVGAGNSRKAEMRRKAFLKHMQLGLTIREAMERVGWTSIRSYHRARKLWPEWATQIDAAAAANKRQGPDKLIGPPRVYGKRDEFLAALRRGLGVAEACAAVGWTDTSSYRKQRSLDPDFAEEVDRIVRPGWYPTDKLWTPADGFVGFRDQFLDHKTPWFHQLVVDAINEMPPGSVLLILFPPEHGKTSFWEDYDIFRLCVDPSTRITVGSEKLAQATKIVRYVRTMLDHEAGGMAPLRDQFGPFAPPKGAERTASAAQAWSAAAFDVAKKPKGLQGQRDFSMQALGMRSSIVGTRCDILQVDDPQSRESLRKKENTEQLVDNFRQDWLSRPGEDGITVILMNRVGEGDFPQFLMEKTELVTRVLKVKAWDPERGGWAWPERYSQADYLAKRKKVGEDAWQRNFMQIGLADRDATFTDKILAKAKNHLRSIMHAPPRPPGGGQAQIIITVDPGKAKTSFHVAALEPDRFVSLDLRLLENAMAYGVFGDVVHELCVQFHRPGLALVTTVIVETKAFQSLLMTDQSMLAAQKQFNFELRPFDTGTLKNDEDFGVPQVARMMERGEIDFPDMDAQSQERYAPLYAQCRRWRPMKRGNRLEQDHVMTLWFAVDYWNLNVRGRHGDGDGDSSAFDFGR